MPNFGCSEFLTIFLHQNSRKKFGTPNFGHSEFLPAFFYTKIVGKSPEFLEWPKLLEGVGFFTNYIVVSDLQETMV